MNVVVHNEVTVVALMHAVDAEEVSGGCVRCDRPFDTANEGGIVVVEQGHRGVL
jgi:hypothetical protein